MAIRAFLADSQCPYHFADVANFDIVVFWKSVVRPVIPRNHAEVGRIRPGKTWGTGFQHYQDVRKWNGRRHEYLGCRRHHERIGDIVTRLKPLQLIQPGDRNLGRTAFRTLLRQFAKRLFRNYLSTT